MIGKSSLPLALLFVMYPNANGAFFPRRVDQDETSVDFIYADTGSAIRLYAHKGFFSPDIILLSGGTENGANKSIVRMLEIILFCIKHLPAEKLPELVYAGNSAIANKIQEMTASIAKLSVTDNIRPTLDDENLMPALTTINEIAPFNVFTETPIEGVHYELDPQFGTATGSGAFQRPRTFELDFGIRF